MLLSLGGKYQCDVYVQFYTELQRQKNRGRKKEGGREWLSRKEKGGDILRIIFQVCTEDRRRY